MTRTLFLSLLLACGLPACGGRRVDSVPLATPVPKHSNSAPGSASAAAEGAVARSHTTHTNRLSREKSPYLLQHQHNPVNWQAWGEEAFAQARRESKPIFLSIGYSTCHWCHVMERESFENEGLAQFLNAHFISIKVDREERPDVDKIYMTFVQAMTGQGGWPLNVFLTPELKPFYGGTYWPPEARQGRPGFLQVLQQIDQAWQGKREQLEQSSTNLHVKLLELVSRENRNPVALAVGALGTAGTELKEGYDRTNGGWGTAPKFPSPSHPAFVLRHGVRARDQEAIDMVLQTCRKMAAGGIYDQLGGGFSRYSVDAKWLVPHFEKMLYDNAQLLGLYLDCYLVSGDESFAEVARDILRYVLRDMTHPEGGFYSAEDADSEGKEGKFYCWTRAEMEKLLAPDEFRVAVRVFGVTEQGNFLDHSDPDPLPNQNVLSLVDTNLTSSEGALLASAKEKLFRARGGRVRPHLDDKILASWNGLMLGNLARAGVILGQGSYLRLRSETWPSCGPSCGMPLRRPFTTAGGTGNGTGPSCWTPTLSCCGERWSCTRRLCGRTTSSSPWRSLRPWWKSFMTPPTVASGRAVPSPPTSFSGSRRTTTGPSHPVTPSRRSRC